MDISYRGTHFHGWQIQPNGKTIQEEIERGLSLMLGEATQIVGSGRTDAGVHATQQIAHFDTNRPEDPSALEHKLNSYLTHDISINRITEVDSDTHARFSAVKRTYHYHLHQKKNPFLQDTSYYFHPQVDVGLINEACEIIRGWQNFECFSKVHTDVNHFDCEIVKVSWTQDHSSSLFDITANRFLRGMVRAIVGTLLDVGTEKISLSDLKVILESGDRKKAGRAVPAHGLFLQRVDYEEERYK